MNRRDFTKIVLSLPVAGAAVTLISPQHLMAQTPSVATPTAGITPQLPVTVTDIRGNEVTISDVSRIVSLNGNVTETLFALGLGENIVALDVSALYPPAALALPKIGYQRDLSAEGILSFAPTLIIGSTEAGPEDVIQQIRDANTTTLILEAPTSPDEAAVEIQNIANAVGLPDAGAALATQVTDRLAEAKSLAAESSLEPQVAFLYIRGEGTQMIAGANSAADGVITKAGGINVGAKIGIDGYKPITPEALIEAAPDIILVMQGRLASVGGVEGLLNIPGVRETPAGQDEQIVAFEDLYLLGFGPRIGDSVYDLTLALHPDVEGTPLHPEWQGTDVDLPSPQASPAA